MSIRVEETLFYIHGKNTSIIIENVNGYLLLRHVGRRVNQYHQSNAVFEKDHAFS
ncbi:MAG: alpha-galactosidase, partial [Globicatella sulfidifaciens]|nr:alpha-galactosidase [Globicatella sulfidifaciens]